MAKIPKPTRKRRASATRTPVVPAFEIVFEKGPEETAWFQLRERLSPIFGHVRGWLGDRYAGIAREVLERTEALEDYRAAKRARARSASSPVIDKKARAENKLLSAGLRLVDRQTTSPDSELP